MKYLIFLVSNLISLLIPMLIILAGIQVPEHSVLLTHNGSPYLLQISCISHSIYSNIWKLG